MSIIRVHDRLQQGFRTSTNNNDMGGEGERTEVVMTENWSV